MTSRLIGAVLAGGASTRMGREKALVDGGNGPLAARAAAALVAAGAEQVVLVGAAASVAEALGLSSIDDRWPGEGPLGGIATAVSHVASLPTASGGPSECSIVAIVACDQPDLDAESIGALVRRVEQGEPPVDVAATRADGRVSTFPSAWRATAAVADSLARAMAAGERRASAGLDVVAMDSVDLAPTVVADIDTPESLADHRHALGLRP